MLKRARHLVLLLVAAMTASGLAHTPSTAADAPSLLVILVVDQMRADYLTRFDRFWKAGIRRLLSEGAVFEEARYPYLNTVTCVGHATISTGSLPARHGIVLNEWLQRNEGRRRSCTDDPAATPVPYAGGTPEPIGHSAHRLRVPTIGDRLRAQHPGSRVATFSMKPRSAVMLAGHGGLSTWFSDTNSWATSSAFTASEQTGIAAFALEHPVDAARSVVWERLLAPEAYEGLDEALGERAGAGWTSAFPHPLRGAPELPPEAFYSYWERSPYSDKALADLAVATVRSMRLGQQATPDLLGISFSALDYAGHSFGPDSHEVQDTLVRLDQVLGELFAALDREVGAGRYVVAFSADHGVAAIPEQRQALGEDAGRLLAPSIRAVAESALRPLGPGPHVAQVEYTDLYLQAATVRELDRRPEVKQALATRLAALPGVARVFHSDALAALRSSSDPVERAAALSHFAGESGDVILVPKRGWITTNSNATTHGTANDYDQHVPVIFWGPAFVRASRVQTAATPADIAPTLAALIGLPMPDVDGRVLTEALPGLTSSPAR